MYCPQCGDHNETQQSFCRQCGQSLAGVRLALEGRVDEVIAKFDKAEDLLAGGLLTFAIFVIGAIVSLLIGGAVPFAISLLLGFVICLPIVIKGLVRVDRLGRLLDPKKTPSDLLKETKLPAAKLAGAASTDSLAAPNSITENTTLNLKSPGSKS